MLRFIAALIAIAAISYVAISLSRFMDGDLSDVAVVLRCGVACLVEWFALREVGIE